MNHQDRLELVDLVANVVGARQEVSPWLDKRGLAEHFACSPRSIEQAMANGMPHSMIFGRAKFKATECEAWLAENGQLKPRGDGGSLGRTIKCPGGAEDAPGPDTRRNP